MNNLLEKITKISFISLAIFPLLKENINSILIILCVVLTLINLVKSKQHTPWKKRNWMLTSLFWMYALRELLSSDFNFDRILLHLPFLIFPLLFFYRPKFINEKIKSLSLKVFQLSTFIQCLIYFLFFISNHPLNKLFDIRNNIPFFREYVSENYFIEIHPTYFSAYLLVSFTISLFNIINNKNRRIHILNSVLNTFFIVLFSSKIIFLILFLTIISVIVYMVLKKNVKQALFILGLLSLLGLPALFYSSRNVIGERFKEIRTEFNKPIVGDYYNSTNTRVAIFRCTVTLIKQVPFFGYGDALQSQLNACYKDTNDSDFYKKQTFNTHNYYFNLICYGGWPFLMLFLMYLLYVYNKIKTSILVLFLFTQFLIINLTENYFSRHYGIVLFTYLISINIFIKSEKRALKNE